MVIHERLHAMCAKWQPGNAEEDDPVGTQVSRAKMLLLDLLLTVVLLLGRP